MACRLGSECCLPNNRVAGSAPAYRIDSRRPRPTDRTPVTRNADRSRKSVAGQGVSPVIPSARLSNAPGVSDLSRRDGRLLGRYFSYSFFPFLFFSFLFFFPFFLSVFFSVFFFFLFFGTQSNIIKRVELGSKETKARKKMTTMQSCFSL